jgi:hypothetical protein
MAADIEPFSIGSASAFLDQSFSSQVKEAAVEVVFHPRTNEVTLEIPQGVGLYRQFWNKEGRQLFIDALNWYNEDFDNRNLVASYNRSRAMYGNFKGRFEWKTLRFSPTYRASPVFELGYRFRDNTPYFSVYLKSADEESGANTSGVTESPPFAVYFTRSQAAEIAKLFDQAFLLESLADKVPETTGYTERDVYIP